MKYVGIIISAEKATKYINPYAFVSDDGKSLLHLVQNLGPFFMAYFSKPKRPKPSHGQRGSPFICYSKVFTVRLTVHILVNCI